MGNNKYGQYNKKSYSSWRNMKIRCFCKTNRVYKKYGAKGITVCYGLLDFNIFQKVLGTPPTSTHTVDRYPNRSGSYSCGECCKCKKEKWSLNIRWANKKQQADNRDICYNVDIDGRSYTLKDACKIKKLPYKQIHERIKRGNWDIQIAINTPMGKPHQYKRLKSQI